MMITIHGFPAKTKYQDVKILIKQECNINDFILDNLISDTDGTKKVRIGLTDNTEGYKVMKCLDGYRMPGNFVLKAVPIGKAAEKAVLVTSPEAPPTLGNYQQNEQVKARPLSKDEVRLLLNLISKHRVITNTSTNASSNKMKVDAWKSVAHAFGVATGEFRRAAQLRLKWENLKKNARRRNIIIKQNNSKTGGRRRYIPPDETLDRVAALLGASRAGVKIELDDDSESDMPVSQFRGVESPQAHDETLSSSYVTETSNNGTLSSCFMREPSNTIVVQTLAFTEPEETNPEGKSIEFCAINGGGESLHENNIQDSPPVKQRNLAEDEQQSRIDKNQALAAYFQAKAEKVQLENEKLRLEIELLKNNRRPNVFNS